MSGARYPVMVDVSRIRTMVVGGGSVAARKAAGLVEAGGLPVIVSPEVCDELRALIEANDLVWIRREYLRGDADSWYRLVFACTNDPAVNQQVEDDVHQVRTLISRADEGGRSNFHTPSHLRQDEVVVAVSSGGASPLLARRLKERLAADVTPGLGRAARRLAQVRAQVQARWPADEARRRAFWFELITPAFLDLAVEGRDEEVEQAITRCLSQS